MFGFFQEVLDRVDIPEVREGLEQAIEQEIARGSGSMTLVRICGVGEVPEGEVRRFELDHRASRWRTSATRGSARSDAICSHAHYFLSEGEVDVEDETIECPKHGSTFDLDTGAPRTLPATAARRGVRDQGGGRRRDDRGTGGELR